MCLSVRSYISKTRVKTSQYFLYLLTVTTTRSSSDDNAIGYVYDIVFIHNWPGTSDTNRAYTQSQSPGDSMESKPPLIWHMLKM